MTVRHLRNSIWHMLIATVLTSLFLTGCGRGGDDETDSDVQSIDSVGTTTPTSGTYASAANMDLGLLESKLAAVPDLDQAAFADALRILKDPNATNQQISDAISNVMRQLIAVLQSQSLTPQQRSAYTAIINKLAQELAAKTKALAKMKTRANILSGVKSILGMLINAAVGIIGMFKK